MYDSLDQLAVNSMRMLSMDQINRANSGHPGLPLGASPFAYVLWTRFLKTNPKNAKWDNRDRFVLSAGHGSALLYSLLHLSGFDLSLEDLKAFRQLGSKTPGHPEYGHTDGVEATTGPLGQGIANAVGMAMAESHLAGMYNKENFPIVDHYTYALCGDGDLMEGVSQEAASLAAHLKLDKLIVLYDSNDICLDGDLDSTFSESVEKRFEAYGWQVLRVDDGNDFEAIEMAIKMAKENKDQPTLIEIKTVIGFGSPKAGTSKVHGAPLGGDDTSVLRENLSWEHKEFEVPKEAYAIFKEKVEVRGQEAEEAWKKLFHDYEKAYPELAKEYKRAMAGDLNYDFEEDLTLYEASDKAMATRKASHGVIQAIAKHMPEFWGGSADLASSNNTLIDSSTRFSKKDPAARNIWYGVREFAMGAIANGILLHGGTRTYVATFFVFSDYLRGAVRLSALSKLPNIFVFTHDSVGVGEDGPTHEPVEHLASWRAMPNLDVIRPCDANETAFAWLHALENKDRPTMLVLSRQNLPILPETKERAREGIFRGGYVLSREKENLDAIIIATGSEVGLAMEVQDRLYKEGIDTRVVSLPSFEVFDRQPECYREAVLPDTCMKRMSIEAGVSFGWERYVGLEGLTVGIDRFGASGKGDLVLKELGMDVDKIVEAFKKHFA